MWVKQVLAVIVTSKIRRKKFGLKFNVPINEHHDVIILFKTMTVSPPPLQERKESKF